MLSGNLRQTYDHGQYRLMCAVKSNNHYDNNNQYHSSTKLRQQPYATIMLSSCKGLMSHTQNYTTASTLALHTQAYTTANMLMSCTQAYNTGNMLMSRTQAYNTANMIMSLQANHCKQVVVQMSDSIIVSTAVTIFVKVYLNLMDMPEARSFEVIVAARDDLSQAGAKCRPKAQASLPRAIPSCQMN